MSVAPAREDLVREISSCAEIRGDYVVLGTGAGDVKALKQRLGVPRHLNIDASSFNTILS